MGLPPMKYCPSRMMRPKAGFAGHEHNRPHSANTLGPRKARKQSCGPMPAGSPIVMPMTGRLASVQQAEPKQVRAYSLTLLIANRHERWQNMGLNQSPPGERGFQCRHRLAERAAVPVQLGHLQHACGLALDLGPIFAERAPTEPGADVRNEIAHARHNAIGAALEPLGHEGGDADENGKTRRTTESADQLLMALRVVFRILDADEPGM